MKDPERAILTIIKNRFAVFGTHSTYRTIVADFRNAYPNWNVRESTIERIARKLAQEELIVRRYLSPKEVIFLPRVDPDTLTNYWNSLNRKVYKEEDNNNIW